jgi:hypothetical protein
MLQMQVPVATMIVMGQRIGAAETLKFRSHATVEVIQNGGFAKRFHSDGRKVCKFMRWRENGDIALFEQCPIVYSFRRITQITNEGDINLALQK